MWTGDDKKLIGKKVVAALINDNKTIVRLELESEAVHLKCYGDCCSETWIEHINGADDIPGKEITGVEEKELGKGIPTRQEFDQVYSTKLKFVGGWHGGMSIEYRNSSNGCYGGLLEVHPGDAERPAGFVPLTNF